MATSFTLEVPHNPAGSQPINRVTLRLSLENNTALSLQITDPGGNSHTYSPAVPAVGGSPGSASHDYPAVNGRSDFVLVQREGGTAATDPVRSTCVVQMTLNTDFVPATCSSVSPGTTENWQFTVTAGPEISGVCHISMTPDPAAGCTGALNLPASTPLAQLARVDGQADQLCGLQRENRPAQVDLVLDRSGSMSANSNLNGLAMTRMEALHKAVQNMVGMWDSLDAPSDRIGVVTFDDLPPEQPFGVGLLNFGTAKGTISTDITSVTPRGWTSIGAGLIKGAQAFDANSDGIPDSTDRKVILLMSDGQQNTDPHVGVDLATQKVFTFNQATPAVKTDLPLLGNYQIYNVTVGPDAAVEPAIKYNMANATGGFYLNTETDGNLLTPFFLDLLGSFVHFNSWETARLIHDVVTRQGSFTTELFLATTTQWVVVNLSWDTRLGNLRFSLSGPVGSIPSDVIHDFDNGTARVSFDPTGLLHREKPWQLRVDLGDLSGLGQEHGGAIPFDLVVLVEDVAISATLQALPKDYKPGDAIELEIRGREFGLPLEQLGSNPGDQVLVQIVRPGQSIGDILSDGTSSTQPPPNDSSSPAQAKLANMLVDDPAAFKRNDANPDIVTLSQAEPGVYRGTFPAPVTGHYNFLFAVTGNAPETGRFSRQAIRTVYVRAVPDAGNTQVQTSVAGSVVNIVFTPRTAGKDRMGPGWASHFWLTAPGAQPVKARDNLDGSYSATLSFAGATPPPVTLHFVDVLQSLGDDVAAGQLPTPLGSGTTVIPVLPGTGNGGGAGDTLRGCLMQLVGVLVTIVRLLLRVLERLQKLLGGS